MRDRRSPASRLKDRIRIEQSIADTSLDGAGSAQWVPIAVDPIISAEIEDMLPSRGERLANGINVATHPARVRLRGRGDVKSSMRFVQVFEQEDGSVIDGRVMQITAGPAKIGRGELVEFMAEDYSVAGGGA